jgi:hypothetical protein
MSQPIVYVDVSRVRDQKFGELESAMGRLASFVEKNVPQLISYAFFVDQRRSQMTVVAVHPNSASLEYHMEVGRDEFRRFSDLIELMRIDVYGEVSAEVVRRLEEKVRTLGNGSVSVHEFVAGFAR